MKFDSYIKPVIIAFKSMNQKKSQTSLTSFAQIKSKIKVVFLGEQSTGKTSILMRFIHDKFEESLGATIGIDFMAKNLHIGNNILRMQLWDTAGQQRFRSLIPSYLKDALIAFVVFDLTSKDQKSFNNLNEWIDLCQNNKKEKSVLILLGNKADLNEEREVAKDRIRLKLQETSLPYFQVSAKTGQNIKEAFQFAGNQYFNNHLNAAELTLSSFGEKLGSDPIKQDVQQNLASRVQEKRYKQQIKSPEKKESKAENKLKLQGKKQAPKKNRCC